MAGRLVELSGFAPLSSHIRVMSTASVSTNHFMAFFCGVFCLLFCFVLFWSS
jgi:hypothetical protein